MPLKSPSFFLILGLVAATFLYPTIQAQPADPSTVFQQALAENVDSVIDRAISDQ